MKLIFQSSCSCRREQLEATIRHFCKALDSCSVRSPEAAEADARAQHSDEEAEGTADQEPGKESESEAAQEAGQQPESQAAQGESNEGDQEPGRESESQAAQEAGKQAELKAAQKKNAGAELRAAQIICQQPYSKEMPGTESETTATEAEHEAAKSLLQQGRNQRSEMREGACDTCVSQSGQNTAGSSNSAQQAECSDGPSETQRLATCESKENGADQSQRHEPNNSYSGTVKGRQQFWASKSSLSQEMLHTALLAGLGPRAKKRQLRRQLQAALDARDRGGKAATDTI